MLLAASCALNTSGISRAASQEAVVYTTRGFAKVIKGDEEGAMADFNSAIKLDPKFAIAYEGRAQIELDRGNVDAAAADYNRALELDPNDPLAYAGRGDVKHHTWDIDGAISDYNRAIRLDSNLAPAYCMRGDAKVFRDDPAGAIADYDQALKLNPQIVGYKAYDGRGNANFLARKWTDASRDYKRACETSKRDQEYPRLLIWLIRSRLGEGEAANKELAAYYKTMSQGWTSKIAAYLLGNLSEADLVAGAASTSTKTDRGQHCEARFYIGTKKLIAGDKPAAADYFKKCLATKQENLYEYQFAKGELKALGQ